MKNATGRLLWKCGCQPMLGFERLKLKLSQEIDYHPIQPLQNWYNILIILDLRQKRVCHIPNWSFLVVTNGSPCIRST